MIARWQALAARDRFVLGVGGGLLALMLGWAFVWYPLAQGQSSLAAKLTAAEANLAFMQQAAAGLRAARASGATGVFDRGGQSLLALVDRSAREAGLGAALRRVEPLQDVRVAASFEGANFDAFAGWLESLHQRYGVTVDELQVDRKPGVGLVDARVTLRDAPTR